MIPILEKICCNQKVIQGWGAGLFVCLAFREIQDQKKGWASYPDSFFGIGRMGGEGWIIKFPYFIHDQRYWRSKRPVLLVLFLPRKEQFHKTLNSAHKICI
jgi:hypothetical protein